MYPKKKAADGNVAKIPVGEIGGQVKKYVDYLESRDDLRRKLWSAQACMDHIACIRKTRWSAPGSCDAGSLERQVSRNAHSRGFIR